MNRTGKIGVGLILVAGLMFGIAVTLGLIAEHQETTSLPAKLIGFWGLFPLVTGIAAFLCGVIEDE